MKKIFLLLLPALMSVTVQAQRRKVPTAASVQEVVDSLIKSQWEAAKVQYTTDSTQYQQTASLRKQTQAQYAVQEQQALSISALTKKVDTVRSALNVVADTARLALKITDGWPAIFFNKDIRLDAANSVIIDQAYFDKIKELIKATYVTPKL